MTGIETVLDVLQDGGFVRLPKPLTVAGVHFEFEAAARGTGASHDLVVIATASLSPRRLQRLVNVLARTLDLAGSKRPITVIVLGTMAATNKVELERHARVLTLKRAEPTVDEVQRAAAVLLPLSLPSVAHTGGDPLEEVVRALGTHTTKEHLDLVRTAVHGEERVKRALRDYVNHAVPGEESADD